MNELRILDELSYFPERVCEPFELEGKGMGSSLQVESLGGIDTVFTAFAKVFVLSFQLIGGKESL